ncbi:4107_t:CDS:2, partial [Gigaspora margarita]
NWTDTPDLAPEKFYNHLVKRCSFLSKLIGDCDDGLNLGDNCSVLPCKQGLVCKNDPNTGTPTCTIS